MTGKNLRRRMPYVIAAIFIITLGAFVLLLSSRLREEKEKLAGEPGRQISSAGAASSESLDKFMSSMRIQKVEEDVEAPGFELENLEGKKVSLKDYRGKVVLLNFMATWCHWCRKEMPHLQKLYDRFKNRDFVIVSVFSDREGARVVVPFIERSGYTFSVSSGLLDPTGRVSGIYRVTGTPTSYLIDREGKIIGWEVGYREWFSKDARNLIEGLLESG